MESNKGVLGFRVLGFRFVLESNKGIRVLGFQGLGLGFRVSGFRVSSYPKTEKHNFYRIVRGFYLPQPLKLGPHYSRMIAVGS